MALTEAVAGAVLPSDGSTTPKFYQGFYDSAGGLMYAPRVDNSTAKNLRISLYDSLGNPLLVADDAAFTPGTNRVLPIGAFADETGSDSVDEGDLGAVRMTLDRKLHVVPNGYDGTSYAPVRVLPASTSILASTLPMPMTAIGLKDTANARFIHAFTASSIADAETGTSIGTTALEGFNGTTWDRIRSSRQDSSSITPTGILATLPHLVDRNNLVTRAWSTATADATGGEIYVGVQPVLWNGASTDRHRGNTEGTLLASAVRAASTNTSNQVNYNGRGSLALYLDVTANPGGAETLQVILYGVSPIPGSRVQIVAFTAGGAAANAQYGFLIGPELTEALGMTAGTFAARAKAFIPRTWSIQVVHSAAGSWTYSLGYAVNV